MMTIRQLEIFVEVARQGSFRRAAERLHISQVAVSEHIRALELRLSASLFQRKPGAPAMLTDAGNHAYRRAIEILADISDFADEISGRSRDSGRRIAIAIDAFLMRDLQEPLIGFRDAHPGIDLRIDLDIHSPRMLIDQVRNRELDLATFIVFDDEDAPGSEFLREEYLEIYVGAGHPLAGRGIITPAQLRDTPAIHLSPRKPLRSCIDRALAAVGAGGGKVAIETDEFGLVLSSVHRNLGFVCMFRAAEGEGQAAGLVRVPLSVPIPPLQVRIATRKSVRDDPILLSLRTLCATLADQRQEGLEMT